MGDQVEVIPEPPSPIHVEDGEFTPNYDPSPNLTELGPVISRIVFISRGSFESFGLFYPAHMFDPSCDCPPEHWLYWCDLSFLT